MPTVEERLAALGLTVHEVVPPVAAYVPAVVTGRYVYTSGQLPFVDGVLPKTGKVGAEVTPEEAHELAPGVSGGAGDRGGEGHRGIIRICA